MDVYRIHKKPYHREPLSVVGSHRHSGRWNPKGTGILHTRRTPELALLETLVHLPPLTLAELPQLWLTTLRLPDEAENIFWLDPAKLPAYWKRGTLAVPSVILEISYNLLLHPQHTFFAEVKVVSQSPISLVCTN